MGKIRKKSSNPLGTYNRLLPSTDKETFCNISLPLDDSPLQSIPNSQEKTVWSCSYGWLLISKEDESCNSYQFSVWKPESLEVINLPPLNLKPNQIICAATLLSPPDNPGSMVLLFEKVLRYFIIYRFGDKDWTKRWFGKDIADIGCKNADDFIHNGFIAHCDGKLYVATLRRRKLMVIEENRPKNLKLRPLNCSLPIASSPSYRRTRYLLDFCGQLCTVEVSWGGVNHQDIVDIDVSKLEFSGNRMKWVEVKSAEDRAFFLSDNYAFSCPVNEAEIEGGCIYFSENKRFYSVNIEHKRISVSLPLDNLLRSENSLFLAMRDFGFCNPQAKPEHTISKLEAEDEGIVMEDNGETRARNICDLPFDILELIAKNLYLVDYINFRSVCNTFRLVAPHIKWSEASFKLQSQSLSPWLIFNSPAAIHNFIDPHLGGRYLTNIPKCLLNGKIRYSKNGWLLMSTPNFMFFYHPFRKKVIKFPQEQRCCYGYGLSSSPTSQDSILVGSGFHSIYYFCLREGEWNEYVFPDYDFEPNHNSPIYFDGAFYFLGRDGKLGVFGWNDGQVCWEILREPKSPCDCFCYNYLLESEGNLLSVFVDDQSVHVYKLNFTTVMAWEKVTSLGNHALFVSPSSSFSVIPSSSDMENKIYFPKLFGKDIVCYCFSTDKFYTCGNKEVVADFNNTTEFLFSTWIEPKWQL